MKFLLILLVLFGCGGLPVSCWAQDVSAEIRNFVQNIQKGQQKLLEEEIHTVKTLTRFYQERGYKPAWNMEEGSGLYDQLLRAVKLADEQGLNSKDYHLSALRTAKETENSLAMEILTTDAYLTLAAHIVGGRLDPETFEPDWTANRRERDLVKHLEETLVTGDTIVSRLTELEPDAPGYQILKKTLKLYRRAKKEGGWESIPDGKAMKVGESGPRVEMLIRRLKATGLLEKETLVADLYNEDVEAAVAEFQRRIGLEADGIVGSVTLRELNKTPLQRIGQIKANLERWRWLPEELGARHIRVNVADFRLQAYQDMKVVRNHDVIVGRSYRKTPVFSDQIAYLVFNPWWDTPDKLARLDKLPVFRKDPAAVKKLGFQIYDRQGNRVEPESVDWSNYSSKNFPFRLRQQPGDDNALGKVKIMFPNKHNVYLHDTPSKDLFLKNERAFSSGCIRVAGVLGLAEWLLEDTPGWNSLKIDEALSSRKETRVNLVKKIPVYILYFTAVSDEDGNLRLINDVYERDDALIRALPENDDYAVE